MQLHVKHEEFRLAHHSDKSVPEFLSYVCNSVLPLPQDGCDGLPMHMPVSWLGVAPIRTYTPSYEATRSRQALGWKSGIPYLIILEGPQPEDLDIGVALSGKNGEFMRRELELAGIPLDQVLVTFGARFALPWGKKYAEAHFRVGQPYVVADIQKCQPQVIIACGAKIVKALFNDKTKLSSVRGSVVPFSTAQYFSREVTAPLIPTESPASFALGYGDIEVFRSELVRARQIVEGSYATPAAAAVDYRVIDTVKGVQDLVAELLKLAPRHIAFDTEFGNDVAREEFSYTLSVQLAWGAGKAAFIKLRDQQDQPDLVEERPVGKPRKDGTQKTRTVITKQRPKCGIPVFSPSDEKLVWAALHTLMLDKRIRLDGQHLRVDVEQFNRNGANIDLRIIDGFDTMLVHHLLKGDDSQGLDHLVRKYAPHFGAYWRDLDAWKSSPAGEGRTVFGYRDVPLNLLIPYGLADADATWQVAEELEKELKLHPQLESYYKDTATWTSLHLLDVERQGILVDDSRRMEIREQYLPVYEDLKARLQKAINWPDFSPSSKPNLAYLLFSEWDWKGRDKLREVVPADVKLLKLKPLYNTDKHPIQWDDILEGGQSWNNTPCTKAAVLDQLAEENPQLDSLLLLKHMSVLGKFLSTYLSPVVLNEFGVPEGGKGFAENIWSDGRVRTRLSMLTETGRYTSSSSNLQVQPKKQEDAVLDALVYHKFGISLDEYKKRTFDGDKKRPGYSGADKIQVSDRLSIHQFKSCFIPKEGYTFIEADFKTAELYIWAYASGDPGLLAILGAGRDMHSEGTSTLLGAEAVAERDVAIAKLGAGDRAAYDAWCSYIKANHEALRIGYKSTIFGRKSVAINNYLDRLYAWNSVASTALIAEYCLPLPTLERGFARTSVSISTIIRDAPHPILVRVFVVVNLLSVLRKSATVPSLAA